MLRSYDEIVTGFQRDDKPGGTSYYSDIPAGTSVLYEDFDISNTKHGILIRGSGQQDIYNYEFTNANPVAITDTGTTNRIHANAVRISTDDDLYDIDAPVTFQRVYANGESRPLPFEGGYDVSNKDFISNNNHYKPGLTNAPIYVRDFTAENFSDAIFDNKGTVYLMNGTLSNAYRILRAWPGAEIVIVNSVIELGEGTDLIWLADETSRVKYFNVLWNGKADPDPDLIDIRDLPKGWTKEEFLAKTLIKLDENILADMDPFFQSITGQYRVDYSVDGGAWQRLALDPALYTEDGVIGDPKIETPNFGNGDYRVRVSVTDSSGKTQTDQAAYTIDNAGFNFAPDDPRTDPPKPAEPTPEAGVDYITGEGRDSDSPSGSGNDVLSGSKSADWLKGEAGNDKLSGGDGDDSLFGGAGDDFLKGGEGEDLLNGGDGDDELVGRDGNDLLNAQNGDDILSGGKGNDSLRGNGGNDDINGNSGNDRLQGGAGDDDLRGGSGDDILHGGDGSNILNGGSGADTFVFSKVFSGGRDLIRDFSASEGDQIKFFKTFEDGAVRERTVDKFIRVDKLKSGDLEIYVDRKGTGKNFEHLADIELSDRKILSLATTDSLATVLFQEEVFEF